MYWHYLVTINNLTYDLAMVKDVWEPQPYCVYPTNCREENKIGMNMGEYSDV
jgi:hypothetical protein